jgi:hypothetical protein
MEKILSITLLEDLQPWAPELSEDVLIITYPNASDIPTSPTRAKWLQLTALELGSNEDLDSHTPSPLSIEEDLFDDDVEDMSKVPSCDIKGLNVVLAEQDLEEFMVAQEDLLDLSAITNRDCTKVVEEDDNFIKVYIEARIIYYCWQGFMFKRVCYDPRQELTLCSIQHWHAATHSINKNSSVAVGTEPAMQGSGSHNHRNIRQ